MEMCLAAVHSVDRVVYTVSYVDPVSFEEV
jgi:hypothetical protein